MLSDAADGVGAAVGVAVEEIVVDGVHEFHDSGCATGEVDEAKGVTGALSSPPAPCTANANASDAPTRANVSDALRLVMPGRRGVTER